MSGGIREFSLRMVLEGLVDGVSLCREDEVSEDIVISCRKLMQTNYEVTTVLLPPQL